MLIYAGIDEAGYGPLLGPLCVGLSVFRVGDHDPQSGPPDLWRLLRRAVCRRRRDRRNRIPIDDSKKLKGPASNRAAHPLHHLERGVLSFLAATGECPDRDEAVFARLLERTPEAPWYASTTPLPLGLPAAQLRITANRLLKALAESNVECLDLRCEALDAGRFNELVGRSGNKATVNLAAALRLVERVWGRWGAEHPRVIVDRHGGRTHYRDDLRLGWPDAEITVLAESEALSRYRLAGPGGRVTVSFVKEAESRHFPVALASMQAKYVRELFMIRLNRFFQGHLPELRPTAGYVTDARRYLEEIDPLVERLALPRPELVRVF